MVYDWHLNTYCRIIFATVNIIAYKRLNTLKRARIIEEKLEESDISRFRELGDESPFFMYVLPTLVIIILTNLISLHRYDI